MYSVLVRNWWAFVFRAIFAIIFGLIALFLPGVTMLSLVLVFAIYAIADGIFAIVASVKAGQQGQSWGLLALEGVVSILAGVVSVLWPGLTVVVFVALIAAWALITGGLLLAVALRVDNDHGRIWLIVASIVSILYGALLIVAPMIGALVLTWWIGAYALIFGIAMLVFALRLHSRFQALVSGGKS